jgi:hypothetical protein
MDSTLLREGHDKQHPNIWQSPLVSVRIRCTVSYNSARVHDDDHKLINDLTDWLNNSMEQSPSQSIRFLQTPLKRRHSSTTLHGVKSQNETAIVTNLFFFHFFSLLFPRLSLLYGGSVRVTSHHTTQTRLTGRRNRLLLPSDCAHFSDHFL